MCTVVSGMHIRFRANIPARLLVLEDSHRANLSREVPPNRTINQCRAMASFSRGEYRDAIALFDA